MCVLILFFVMVFLFFIAFNLHNSQVVKTHIHTLTNRILFLMIAGHICVARFVQISKQVVNIRRINASQPPKLPLPSTKILGVSLVALPFLWFSLQFPFIFLSGCFVANHKNNFHFFLSLFFYSDCIESVFRYGDHWLIALILYYLFETMDKWCGNFWHSQMMISVYVFDVLNWFDCCSFAFSFLKFELSLFYFGEKEFQRVNESTWVEFLCLCNFFLCSINSTSEMILQNEHAIFLLSFDLEIVFLFSKNLSIRS